MLATQMCWVRFRCLANCSGGADVDIHRGGCLWPIGLPGDGRPQAREMDWVNS